MTQNYNAYSQVTKSRTHYAVVDFLKVIAVQIIIIHHLSKYGIISRKVLELFPDFIHFMRHYGRFAVQLFLVMGGYLAAKHIPCSIEQYGLFKTCLNRYLRLVIPFLVAIFVTMACADFARFTHYENYLGQPETFYQILAHVFFLQSILGYQSISVGVWYVAIDLQLFVFISLLLFTFKKYRNQILILSVLIVSSMYDFSLASAYDAYFFYFINAYGLGVIAFFAGNSKSSKTQRDAKMILLVIALLVVCTSMCQIYLKNILDISVALLLAWKGTMTYNSESSFGKKCCIWISERSYCAFLIHFSVLLLGNTLYVYCNFESATLAAFMMFGVWLMSWVSAHLLYILVEFPSRTFHFSRSERVSRISEA